MEDNASPLLLRRRLRTELLGARLDNGFTQQQVAEAMDWSLSKMNRIEKAKSGISTNDLKALLGHYRITDQERVEQLLALARGAKQDPWWQSYSDVAPDGLLDLMNYESASSVVSQFEITFVPGILQTEEYASAVLQGFYNEKSDERMQRLVELLSTKRRELLTRENAPEFSFVLDESVTRRPVGSHSVMRQQFQHLVNVTDLRNVKIQVVPFAAGIHRGMAGAFEVVQFEDTPDENIAFLEGQRDFISEDPEVTRGYLELFGHITDIALDRENSLKLFLEAAGNRA
jgi:transcriptional regulator with XRE-family HTH domain